MCQFPVSASIADWLLRGKLQLKKKSLTFLKPTYQELVHGLTHKKNSSNKIVCGSDGSLLVWDE